jgi:hypothetical protein
MVSPPPTIGGIALRHLLETAGRGVGQSSRLLDLGRVPIAE